MKTYARKLVDFARRPQQQQQQQQQQQRHGGRTQANVTTSSVASTQMSKTPKAGHATAWRIGRNYAVKKQAMTRKTWKCACGRRFVGMKRFAIAGKRVRSARHFLRMKYMAVLNQECRVSKKECRISKK